MELYQLSETGGFSQERTREARRRQRNCDRTRGEEAESAQVRRYRGCISVQRCEHLFRARRKQRSGLTRLSAPPASLLPYHLPGHAIQGSKARKRLTARCCVPEYDTSGNDRYIQLDRIDSTPQWIVQTIQADSGRRLWGNSFSFHRGRILLLDLAKAASNRVAF